MNIPKKPQKGDRVLQSLYNTVCDIVDYLPSLNVVGDNKTTYVNHSAGGTTIHAIQPNTSTQGGKTYEAGSGLTLSGNVFNNDVTSGRFIEVTSAYAINCILSGGTDIQITPQGVINYTGSGSGGGGYSYIGDGNQGSGHIFVDQNGESPRLISSNLVYIDNLINYPISGDSIGSETHFTQIRDIKDGAGTQVDYHWNSIGDSTEEGGQLIKFIDGICVNLNVSGGTYITTKFHQGVGYGDYTSASIDCNLSGTYDWYPHTSGFIAIVPQYDASQNITGGIISTNLHAGSGIAIDPQTGEITCTIEGGGGGGGGGGNSGWPHWENLCGSGHLVYVQQWYTTQDGGWLRLSNPQGGAFGGCNSIYIDPVVPPEGVEGQNHIGLGNGNISFFLPIPPGSSFWIGLNQDGTQCWFDGTTSPATHTSTDQSTMNELRGYADNASSMFYSGYDSVTATFERASGVFDSASSRWESYYPDNLDQSDKDYFYDWWNELSGYAESLTSYAEGLEELNNQAEAIYANMSTEEGLKYVTSTNNFYLSTSTWATSAVNWAVQTKYYYDNCPTQ